LSSLLRSKPRNAASGLPFSDAGTPPPANSSPRAGVFTTP
jgi:hypothetical protein